MHTKDFGYSDVEKKVPVDGETIFQGASLTKSMVAAPVGMLVNKEKLR
jgi:CubicO group peptidase (beta-lactamase class C family)